VAACIKKHERIKDGVDSIVSGNLRDDVESFVIFSKMILYANNKK